MTAIYACSPDEIVPAGLRGRLGWTEKHDRMAAKTIAEFNLRLPHDRELIRQLTFARAQAGQPIEVASFNRITERMKPAAPSPSSPNRSARKADT